MITAGELRLLNVIQALRTGNPNHDSATGQFSSGGGSGSKKDQAVDRLQARYDANPVKRWPDVHGVDMKGNSETYHVSVHKNAYKHIEKDEKAYLVRLNGKKTGLNDSEGHNTLESAIKAGERMHKATLKDATRESTIGRKKGGRRSLADEPGRTTGETRGFGGATGKPVLSPGRTSKASSAEAILRTCTRRLGFTAQYKRGELTGEQHLELLEEVRLYGRAWLRHEAESFSRHYLLRSMDIGVLRAKWVEGPGGFLIFQDSPTLASHFRRFFGRVKQFVRETIVAGVMSLLGPVPLTGEELDAAERAAQVQDQFLDRFHREIQIKGEPAVKPSDLVTDEIIVSPPPMTPGQFVARAEQYADSAWKAAQKVNRQAAAQNPVLKYERNIMGDARHCGECLGVTSMRWQPIGTLPEIGDRECGPYCHCHFVYSDEPDGTEYIQGTKGLVPAPRPGIELFPDDDEVHMIAEPPGKPINVPVARKP